MRRQARRAAAAAALLTLATAGRAGAQPLTPDTAPPEKRLDVCIATFEEGQLKQRRGDLTNAVTRYSECASPACPAQIKDDCEEARDAATLALPTASFVVRDAAGNELPAKIVLDGKPVDASGGRAISLDPGEHDVKYTLVASGATASQKVVMHEGEKSRVVVLAAPPAPVSAPPSAADPSPARATPVGPIILGGAGVVLLLVAAGAFVFASSDRADRDDLIDELGALDAKQASTGATFDRRAHVTAIHDENDAAKSKELVGFVLGVVGLAAIAGGAAWYVVGRSRSPSAAWRLVPHAAPGSAGASVSLAF